MILIDTPIWSEALRRKKTKPSGNVLLLKKLIEENRVTIIGPIRQEILSGIKETSQFEKLRTKMAAFPDRKITTSDYEQAADFFNRFRKKGIQGSNTDFLICSVAVNCNLEIFTTDNDFTNYCKYLGIRLLSNN